MQAKESRWLRLIVLPLTLAAAVLCAASAQALTWQTTQLTDDSVFDTSPIVSGDYVYWKRHDGNDFEYVVYDGVTTTQITDNNTHESRLVASGNKAAWLGDLGVNNDEIFYYDGATTSQITDAPYPIGPPSISGDNIVWAGQPDSVNDEIFLYDGSSTTQLTSNEGVSGGAGFWGSNIVWNAHDGNDFEVIVYDGVSTTPFTDSNSDDRGGRGSGNNFTWMRWDGNDWEIMFNDGVVTTQLTDNSTDDTSPNISGDNIVWRYDDGNSWEVMFYDGSTTTQLTDSLAHTYSPQVSGDLVVWAGTDGHDSEIFYYDGTTTAQLTDNETHDSDPSLSGDTVVWNNAVLLPDSSEIFMATVVPDCIPGDLNGDGYVDVGGDILTAFSNFTGPGSFGKTYAQGDVHGPTIATAECITHDGDVDVSDLLFIFGNYTGPAPDSGAAGDGGLVAAEAGDANIPDLIYNAATGEVTLDVDGSGIIGYVLKNGSNSFAFGNHLQILAGVKTSVAGELSEAAFASSVGANSIGNVFPTGMNLAALTAYLTVNDVSRSLGAPVVPFDLVVIGGPVFTSVPEPSTYVMAALGLLGLSILARRRR